MFIDVLIHLLIRVRVKGPVFNRGVHQGCLDPPKIAAVRHPWRPNDFYFGWPPLNLKGRGLNLQKIASFPHQSQPSSASPTIFNGDVAATVAATRAAAALALVAAAAACWATVKPASPDAETTAATCSRDVLRRFHKRATDSLSFTIGQSRKPLAAKFGPCLVFRTLGLCFLGCHCRPSFHNGLPMTLIH